MKMQPIHQDLPELYRHIFPEFFEELVPVEENATCSNCAMCQKPGEPPIPGVEYFKPDVKCCSYFPKLPNYLVGGMLTDPNPALEEGRRRIRERIQNRIGITPQAIHIPKKYAVLHKYGGTRSFGRNQTLICPYYVHEGGLCSIWKFRDAICSTYFCKTMAGKEGAKFWNVLRAYLIHAQDALSWYSLYTMKWDTEVLWEYLNARENDQLEPEDMDETPPSEATYKRLWRDWEGKEEEFYKECYRLVSTMTRDDYQRISGMTEKIFFQWLKDKHNEVINPKIPPVLKKNPELKVYPMPDGSLVAIKTEAGFFTIQNALCDVLNWFDGVKTIEEIKKMVTEQYEDTLGDELVVQMYFNRMLVPA